LSGGCTKLLQPADVSWNAPFKAKYREMYEEWLQNANDIENLTPSGNPRAPSKRLIVEWVKKAWKHISVDIIVRSFLICGITSNDPDIIDCTKIGAVVDSIREDLFALTRWRVDIDASSSSSSSSSEDSFLTEDDDKNEVLF
jgi:hypothetical protein